MSSKNFLGLTIKFPEPGKVKTRLAAELGPERAAEIYRRLAGNVLRRTSPELSEYERVVFFTPADKRREFEQWLPEERLIPQRGLDLGGIMHNAIEDLLTAGADKTVITGVDIPDLDRKIINLAFDALDNADIVIGPAMDGGYYLIGMKALHPVIFQDISWGTEKVFKETVAKIDQAELRLRTVVRLYDVDTPEDLLRLKNLFQCG